MAGTVNLPFIGPTNKAMVYVAGVAGVGALGYAYWKKKKAATTAGTPAAGAIPATGAGYGYGYGYGYGAFSNQYEPYGYGYGPSGLGAYGGATGNYGYGYYGAGEPVNTEVPTAASTNAQWSEAAVTALTSAGWTGQDVLSALGLYLTGAPVNATQAQIIQAAIAAEGYPPNQGASGYPPGIHQSASTGQATGTGGTGGGSAGQIAVPNVAGLDAANAQSVLQSEGLQPSITFTTASNKPGIFHIITKTSPPAGTMVAKGTKVVLYYKDSKTQ